MSTGPTATDAPSTTDDSEQDPAAPTKRRGIQAILFAAPILTLGAAGWAHRWMFDDGFIYLRIVDQVRAGNGPVFNAGERVEAFTSPLWLAILVVADLSTPIRLEWISVTLGIGFSVLGAGLAVAGAAQLAGRSAGREVLVPVGILVFAAVLPTWYYQTSGLETGLVFGWLGACFWVLTRWALRPSATLARLPAVLLGLGWLVRPELVLASIVFLAVVALLQWPTSTVRGRASLVAYMVAVPLAYQIFRMGYFGSTVANTAVAKEGASLRLDSGWAYFLDFVQPYRLWIPIVGLLLGAYAPLVTTLNARGERRSTWVVVAFLGVALSNTGAVVAFGGDYLHGRMLLPALFALCAPVAVVPLSKRYVGGAVVAVWALVCAASLRPPQLDSPSGLALRDGVAYLVPHRTLGRVEQNVDPELVARLNRPALYIVDDTRVFARQFIETEATPARDLRQPTVVTGGIGALGYALGTGVTIVDINGLAEPLAGHLELARRGQTGHEKVLSPAWVAAMVTADDVDPRSDDFLIRPSGSTPPADDLSFSEEVEWARAALECPGISDLRNSVRGDLTPRRFLSNVRHSLSRAQRRVPSDPRVAYRTFCGDSAPATAPPG